MAEITGMSGPVTKIDVLGGVPGAAGVSVTTAELDADGHLLISKSNGVTLDVGKVRVDVTPEVQAAWDGAVAAETEATTQAGIATGAAANAKDSETKAAASAAAASGAAASEAAAKTSETKAALGATNAATSATTATTKAGVASSAATAAATSASNAALSESAAATSESNATAAASNAATSESNAAISAGEAESAASAAAGSANAASSSATAASGSANAAALSASSASGSATAASTSAGQAAGSATAAASAATTAITAGLASGGVIKAADDATLSAAKSYADSGVAQVNTWFLRGNGSPVGVITPASAGVQYVDLQATCGARVWISTGATASAWRVVDGDTGRRTMQSLILNGWSATIIIRRINSLVILEVANLTSTAATSNIILAYAPGFASPRFSIFPIAVQGGTRRVITKTVTESLFERYGNDPYNDAGGVTDVLHWGTTQPWPTTLPGTPA